MIADILLEAKRPQQALAEYQTDLKLNPNRFNGLYGAARAAEAAGKQKDATRVLRAAAESLRRIELHAAGAESGKEIGGAEVIPSAVILSEAKYPFNLSTTGGSARRFLPRLQVHKAGTSWEEFYCDPACELPGE